ncbi:MAG: ring-opening amidohydrolase [bacterium]
MRAEVFRVPMRSPDDIRGVVDLIDSGQCRAEDVVCIMGKTEGNGCVNDFARGFSTFVLTDYFAGRLGISRRDVADRIAMIMSGGTEGVMSPHFTVFARSAEGEGNGGDKRLAIASGHTREFLPEEIGRMAQARETAAEVTRLMKAAQIDSADDLHFVQVKTPLLTTEQVDDARGRHQTVCTDNTYKSMAYSRAASALGIALATGEVREEQLSDEVIGSDWSLSSGVASTSSGIELMCNEIMVVGNSGAWGGDLVIGHSVMQDAIDGEAVKAALQSAGLSFEWRLAPEQQKRVVNILAKCEASPDGRIRDRRHTMLEDSDINSTRHARCVVNAVIASIVGDPMVYVSGGAEHQGPPGGGPVAAIVRVV